MKKIFILVLTVFTGVMLVNKSYVFGMEKDDFTESDYDELFADTERELISAIGTPEEEEKRRLLLVLKIAKKSRLQKKKMSLAEPPTEESTAWRLLRGTGKVIAAGGGLAYRAGKGIYSWFTSADDTAEADAAERDLTPAEARLLQILEDESERRRKKSTSSDSSDSSDPGDYHWDADEEGDGDDETDTLTEAPTQETMLEIAKMLQEELARRREGE